MLPSPGHHRSARCAVVASRDDRPVIPGGRVARVLSGLEEVVPHRDARFREASDEGFAGAPEGLVAAGEDVDGREALPVGKTGRDVGVCRRRAPRPVGL